MMALAIGPAQKWSALRHESRIITLTQCQAPTCDEEVDIRREEPEPDQVHDVDKVAKAVT